MPECLPFRLFAVLWLMAGLSPLAAVAQGLGGGLEAEALEQARTFDGAGLGSRANPPMTVLAQAAGAGAPQVAPATHMPKGTGLKATPVPASGKGARREPHPRSRGGSLQNAAAGFLLAMVVAAALNAAFPAGIPLAAVLGIVGGVVALKLYIDYRNGELPGQKPRVPKA